MNSLLKCSRPGCSFTTTSNRGIEVHNASCERKRSQLCSPQRNTKRTQFKPRRFGGASSRVPCDNIFSSEPSFEIEAIAIDTSKANKQLDDLPDKNNEELNSGETNVPGKASHEEANTFGERREKAEEMASTLAFISRKSGRNAANRLMEIISADSFDRHLFKTMFKKSSECISFVDAKFEREMSESGFRKVQLTSSDLDVTCNLFVRDPITVIREQLGQVHHQSLILESRVEVDRTGKQCFGHPMSAKLGELAVPSVIDYIKKSTNKNVFWNEGEKASFVGLGQIYSDKTQTSFRSNALTLYPIHLTLLKFREEDRRSFIISGRSLVGFLPTKYENSRPGNLSREIKMEMLQKAMSEAFRNLMNVAVEGFDCRTADRDLKCHFVLANYVSDLPEAWDMLGVKGQNSSFPCHRCTVPRDLLSIPTNYKLRSVKDTENCGSYALKQRTKTKEMECLDKHSLSVHASFLEKFPFIECSPYLDIYRIFTYEPLHNVYLGVSKLFKEMCCQRLYDGALSSTVKDSTGKYKAFPQIRTALLNGMNQILTCIERDSPATAFKIDFSYAGKSGNYNGFFMKDGLKGMLEAKDHRAVDQVMPFLAMFLDRFCGESLSTSIFTSYAEITMIMFRRNRDPTWNVRDIR